MSTASFSRELARADLFARGRKGRLRRRPFSRIFGISSPKVTPASTRAYRALRSICRIWSMREKLTVSAAGFTDAPWKCGCPELRGTRGIPVLRASSTRS